MEQSGGEEVLRVVVGRWSDVRQDNVVRRLERGPGASGVFAQPTSTGDAIVVLDADGEPVRTLRAGAGLVAATSVEAQAPTWIVTGTDEVGVAAAAAALTEERLDAALRAGDRARRRRPAAGPHRGHAVIHQRRASPLHAARAGIGAAWCLTLVRGRAVVRAPAAARHAARR